MFRNQRVSRNILSKSDQLSRTEDQNEEEDHDHQPIYHNSYTSVQHLQSNITCNEKKKEGRRAEPTSIHQSEPTPILHYNHKISNGREYIGCGRRNFKRECILG